MTSALAAKTWSQPRTICLVRALQLGDMLNAVPALRALRKAEPEAQITLIGLRWAREFAQRFSHYIDGYMEFPGFPGMVEGPAGHRALPRFLEEAREQRFDLAIQMQGDGTYSNLFTILLGSPRVAGYFLPGNYRPDPTLFFPYPQQPKHEIAIQIDLLERLGIEPAGDELEFPVSSDDRRAASALLGPDSAPIACLHPGSRSDHRRWPADRFAAVGDYLVSMGIQVVITGSAPERELCAEVEAAMQCSPLNLAGQTSLGALAAVVERSALIVCNDTGVSHLAAALARPSVVIFGDSSPDRWAPLNRQLHRALPQPVDSSTVIEKVDQQLRGAGESAGRQRVVLSS